MNLSKIVGPPATVVGREFTMELRGSKRQESLIGVATDTYHPCQECQGDDLHTVTVYRVTNLPLPWWLTLEISCCANGHHGLTAYPASAVLRPSRRARKEVSGHPDPHDRTFDLISVERRRRAKLAAAESAPDYECGVCYRPYGKTIYDLHHDTIPSWILAEVHWCDGCRSGHIETTPHGHLLKQAQDSPYAAARR